MTVYSCPHCWTRHGRLTTISGIGAIHYDTSSSPRITNDLFYGCPQCATSSCALCAAETDGICECGGELVPGIRYQYSVDGRLPSEIAALPSTEERLQALENLRPHRPMIVAAYRHYKKLIEDCQRIADDGSPLPENPGLAKMKKGVDQKVLSPGDAWRLLLDYAVPSNARQMAELLDERSHQYTIELLSTYPTCEEGWSELLAKYESPAYHREHLVPHESAADLCQRRRDFVTLLRDVIGLEHKRQ